MSSAPPHGRPFRVAAPYLQALLVTLLWSTSWVLIKVGLSDDLQPLTFAGLRYTIAAALLVVALVASPRHRDELAATSRATRRAILVLGVVLYAVVGAAFYLAGEVGVTSAVGLTVGAVGLAATAAAALLGRHVNRLAGLSPLTVTAPSMAIGGVLTLVTGLVVDGVPTVSASGWAIVAWLAVVNNAFAFTLWNHTLQSLTATESSAINNTMLVQIAVLAAIFLDEPLTVAQWTALAIVSVGIWFTRTPPRAAGSSSRS